MYTAAFYYPESSLQYAVLLVTPLKKWLDQAVACAAWDGSKSYRIWKAHLADSWRLNSLAPIVSIHKSIDNLVDEAVATDCYDDVILPWYQLVFDYFVGVVLILSLSQRHSNMCSLEYRLYYRPIIPCCPGASKRVQENESVARLWITIVPI